ncbi:MAG: oligosaccharide flippase family protein, partial [Lawsonibacter sp.]
MEEKILSAGKGALLLTALGTVSQVLGFGYRVILSRMIGAEVMGLYQLVMPVYSVLLSVTAVGLTTAISNLTSQYLALNNSRGMAQTLSTCLRFFFLLLLPVGAIVILNSDAISVTFLGDARTQLGLILLIPCAALTGVENFHKHFFYGAGLVGPPAVVDLLEQFIRAAAVLGLLALFLPQYPERVVGLIV